MTESRRVAAVFSLGRTDGGCAFALNELLKRESQIDCYLLYGKPAPGQQPAPEDIARQLMSGSFGGRVVWRETQPTEAWDLEAAYTSANELIELVSGREYHRVYVGITGGSNPMVASLFQTAMAYLRCEVIPAYVQGEGERSIRTYAASAVRDSITREEVLQTAAGGQLRLSSRLAQRLPAGGPHAFVSRCIGALAEWDDFNYRSAAQEIRHAARKAVNYAADRRLSNLLGTIQRIAAQSEAIRSLTADFANEQQFARTAASPAWASRVLDAGPWIVADVLENASRRMLEGRFTDSVLRSYRAAECAVQVLLYLRGINPGRPGCNEKALAGLESCLVRRNGDWEPIAFNRGFRIVVAQRGDCSSQIEGLVQDVQATRNRSYLEHGYQRICGNDAERILAAASEICNWLLDERAGLPGKRDALRMVF